jgi:hypothetical protein
MGCYRPNPPRSPSSPEDVADLVTRYWTPEPLGAIRQLGVVTAALSPRLPHDRHLRFNLGVAIMIQPGFDRLQRTTIEVKEGVAWTYEWKAAAIDRLFTSEQQMRMNSTATCLTLHTA